MLLLLALILLVPLICERMRIPNIIGLIVAGMAFGPHGLGWLEDSETIRTVGQLGMLYVMFTSGIEISMNDLQKSKYKSILFGALSFFLPALLGLAVGELVLGFSWASSLLLAAMLGSHTLMTYPTVSRYGIQKNSAVSITIGGSVVAITLGMAALGVVASIYHHESSQLLWLQMSVGSLAMVATIFYVLPKLTERFFKRYNDSVAESVFVALMAALSGQMAAWAGLEPILGVFLAGLALNRQIPNLSPLMGKISFVGNALFIPIFLLTVGMLIDLRVFATGWKALGVAGIITLVAIVGKWMAAAAAQYTFRLSTTQRRLVFGLTNAHAAGALATVMIGHEIFLPDGNRLFGDDVLNGTVVMILFCCTIASLCTERAAKRLALEANHAPDGGHAQQRLLIPIANPDTTRRLIDLAGLIMHPDSPAALHAMAVVRHPEDRRKVERTLDDVARMAAAADYQISVHSPLSVNIPNGIMRIASAEQMTHIIVGMGAKYGEQGFGTVISSLISSCSQGLWIYHPVQQLKTIRTVRILAPEHAELEPDYAEWRKMAGHIIDQTQADMSQEVMTDWKVLPRIAGSMEQDELLIVVQARRSTISYHPDMEKTAEVLKQHFKERNYIVVFPNQNIGEHLSIFNV